MLQQYGISVYAAEREVLCAVYLDHFPTPSSTIPTRCGCCIYESAAASDHCPAAHLLGQPTYACVHSVEITIIAAGVILERRTRQME